ncbi:UNVERIFIED_CONTAM: hypothetical protein Scaly_1672200 [Sesamum calycinum]|uniref:SWIM-type domain-containing protein n=1 Tax=Sesamum calycinum TaxID=2727403 RepID=A0AAW2NRT5_9LAMI
MALMPIIRPASLVSEGVPDYGVGNVDFEDDEDKGKSVVIEESGDGERADWIDWDRDDEDMRENEEWVADSEDDLYDGDESVDYNEDDEFFDENVDKEAEWAGILQDNFEDEMRFDSDDHTDNDSPDEFDSQKNSDEDNVAKAPVFCPDDTFDPRFALGMKFSHKKEFRGAVHSHAIMTRRNLAITKNDKRRVYARSVKKGFLSGCRPFIGVDGCHLKGPHGGVLLTAVGVENRFCVRHLHGNMKTAGFKGLGYKKALWFAAKTTTVSQFQKAMQDIADLICILEAREKPILTMLEWIRCFDGARYTVDLKEKTCSCRLWDLTGIPCNHAMSAISAQVLDPDDFVHECYHVDTFCKVYPAIMPLDGLEMWEKAGYIPPVPPSFGRKRGRPARARRLEPDDSKGQETWTGNPKNAKAKRKNEVQILSAKTEQHETPIQQDEVIVNEDCPPISQPEEVSAPEADVSKMKKPVKRAIFKDADVAPVAVQLILLLMCLLMRVADFVVNVLVNKTVPQIYPTSVPPLPPPPGFMKVNIRAPPPMVGHHPGFVSRPTTGPTVPYPNGDIIIQDGKKYVTLSNLRSVMTSQNAQPKDKGKRKM